MYENFSNVYDHVMDNVPYDEWFAAIHKYLTDRGITGGTICELGCGTGIMTERFAAAGYHMIGVDQSADMLALAAEKKEFSGADILYVQQSMQKLELSGPVDAMVSVCDSMNYLLQDEDMTATFTRVKKYLKPGGYFIFDLKTAYCYQSIMGNQTWVEQDDEVSYIWENFYYEDQQINEYLMTIFRRQEDSDLYERFEESHYQKAYDIEHLKKLLEKSGLEMVECLDASMDREPAEDSERVYVIARVQES